MKMRTLNPIGILDRSLRWLMRGLVRGYQLIVSPHMPDCCRFTPSCSNYALEAINEHSAPRAFLLIVWRILRCNPFTKGGFDPVPYRHKHTHEDDRAASETAAGSHSTH